MVHGVEKEYCHQHQQASEHGEEDELNGRINAPFATPYSDQKIHRYKRNFPEHIKEK